MPTLNPTEGEHREQGPREVHPFKLITGTDDTGVTDFGPNITKVNTPPVAHPAPAPLVIASTELTAVEMDNIKEQVAATGKATIVRDGVTLTVDYTQPATAIDAEPNEPARPAADEEDDGPGEPVTPEQVPDPERVLQETAEPEAQEADAEQAREVPAVTQVVGPVDVERPIDPEIV